MSTPSRMTIPWDRLDQMALLPEDSSVVIPPPITTIAWTPLLGPTIFDYDPTDMIVTPGADEEAVVAPPTGETGTGETGTGPTGTGTPPPGEGGQPPAHYGRPQLTVAHRRSVKLFLADGLDINIHPTAPAHVRAVLETKVAGSKGKVRMMNLTKVTATEVGDVQGKLTLHPSRAGRVALHKVKGSLSATLEVVVNYGSGQKPIRMKQHVLIVGG